MKNRKIRKIDEEICNTVDNEYTVLLEVMTQGMDFSATVREKISIIIEIIKITFKTQKMKEDSKTKQTKETVQLIRIVIKRFGGYSIEWQTFLRTYSAIR